MIIWQGFGLLTIIVPFIVCILMEQIYAGAPIGLGLIIGGLIVYKLGIHLHDPKKMKSFFSMKKVFHINFQSM